jgi:hypothetical protein
MPGPHKESQPERNSDKTECFCSVFRFADIGNVGLSHSEITCRQAVDDSRQKNQP